MVTAWFSVADLLGNHVRCRGPAAGTKANNSELGHVF